MKPATLSLAALALCLSACLEQDEEITVRPDGSMTVRMAAHGKPADLADGYPVPLGGPWVAGEGPTLEWIRLMGPDTGSPAVRANLTALVDPSGSIRPDEEVELESQADFASASLIPRFLAPETDPFRTAYLERATELRVERKGGRTVYVFERTYRGRTFERLDLLSRIEAALGEELFAKIEDEAPLSEDERRHVVDAGLAALRGVPEAFAADALLAVYTQGDASLSPAGAARTMEKVRAAIEGVVTRERLQRIVDGVLPRPGEPKSAEAEKDVERLEAEVRETLRAAFAAALEGEGVPKATSNALRGELEWLFTARDHTDDLGDEKLSLRVSMPGTIVGGNHDEVDAGAALWRFVGGDLRDRDLVMRVVSVVE